MIRLAPKGFSNMMGVVPGRRAISTEVKAGSNQAATAQELLVQEIREQGAVALAARLIEEVERELDILYGDG